MKRVFRSMHASIASESQSGHSSLRLRVVEPYMLGPVESVDSLAFNSFHIIFLNTDVWCASR